MVLAKEAKHEGGSVGNNLKWLRESRGLSQAELARRIHVDKSTISRIEAEGVRLASHHIERLVKALGCRAEDLVADGVPLNDEEREFIDLIRTLDAGDRNHVIATAKRLRRPR